MLLPQRTGTLRDDAIADIAAEALVVGDIILLEEADRMPADCRLITGFGLRINNATVTGEAIAVHRPAAPSADENMLLAGNVLLAGTAVVSDEGRSIVFATGVDTDLGRIAWLSQAGSEARSPLRRELARPSRIIEVLSVAVGLAFMLIGTVADLLFWQDAIFAIGISLVMVPEGLLVTLTVALKLAAKRMARRNALVRQLTAVEALGTATVICTDKTGTLTENRMRVREVFLGGATHGVDHAALASLAQRDRDFFLAASLCHDLHPGRTGRSLTGKSMEIALVALASEALTEMLRGADAWRTSLRPAAHAPYRASRHGDGLTPLLQERVRDGAAGLQRHPRCRTGPPPGGGEARRLRVLAFACRHVPTGAADTLRENGRVFLGLAGLDGPPHAGVAGGVAHCRRAGIRIIMVTGDHSLTATAIAREIGLANATMPDAIDGAALHRVTREGLAEALDTPEVILALVKPEQKLLIVEAPKAKGHIVAVTGDGVTDAPALREATTACLAAIVTLQAVTVYLCRDAVRSAFSTGLVDIPLIALDVALEAGMGDAPLDHQGAQHIDDVGERIDERHEANPVGHQRQRVDRVARDEDRHHEGLADAHEPLPGAGDAGNRERQHGEQRRAERDDADRARKPRGAAIEVRAVDHRGSINDHRLREAAHEAGTAFPVTSAARDAGARLTGSCCHC